MNQKKALVKWLQNRLTKKYLNFYKNHKSELETNLRNATILAFAGNGIKERSEEEISLHTRLIAVDLIINDFEILFDFLSYCEDNDLDPAQVSDQYEITLTNGEKETRENPLTIFINNFYNNDKK